MITLMNAGTELGNSICWGSVYLGDDEKGNPQFEQRDLDPDDVLQELHTDAAHSLPPGTRYEIRRKIASWYGREHGMAWYRTPAMDKVPNWGEAYDITSNYMPPEGGYFLIGQYVT